VTLALFINVLIIIIIICKKISFCWLYILSKWPALLASKWQLG